jgi:hypothetical protein
MRTDVLMANKQKAAARKMTTRADASRPAKPLSVGTVRGRLGLSRKLFSRLAGFSERAIADWEGGKHVRASRGSGGSRKSTGSATGSPRWWRRRPSRTGEEFLEFLKAAAAD